MAISDAVSLLKVVCGGVGSRGGRGGTEVIGGAMKGKFGCRGRDGHLASLILSSCTFMSAAT